MLYFPRSTNLAFYAKNPLWYIVHSQRDDHRFVDVHFCPYCIFVKLKDNLQLVEALLGCGDEDPQVIHKTIVTNCDGMHNFNPFQVPNA